MTNETTGMDAVLKRCRMCGETTAPEQRALENQTTATNTRDRPASEPGGCECARCGCIFVGAAWHTLCGDCVEIVRQELADLQRGIV